MTYHLKLDPLNNKHIKRKIIVNYISEIHIVSQSTINQCN